MKRNSNAYAKPLPDLGGDVSARTVAKDQPASGIRHPASSYLGFTPVGVGVLVRRHQSVDRVGRIYIPDTAREPAETGEVLAVGSGTILGKCHERQPIDVAVGDVVAFPWTAGEEVRIGVEDLVLIHERHLIGVIG